MFKVHKDRATFLCCVLAALGVVFLFAGEKCTAAMCLGAIAGIATTYSEQG